MKVKSYIQARLERSGITGETAYHRVTAALGVSEIRANDDVTDNTKKIIDHLCKRILEKQRIQADEASKSTNIEQTADPTHTFEESLAHGVDPTTGNPVVPVTLDAKAGRMGYYDPITRATYPMVVDTSAPKKA